MAEITSDIHIVIEALKKGEVVALPTETVYGLAASIDDEAALSHIFTLKNRPQDNPLIVHALNIEWIRKIAEVTPEFEKLYTHFMPGPLTVLLKKKVGISELITCGLDTVACRIPSHPLFRQVLEGVQKPLAAPSANLSTRPSSTTPQHVLEDFKASHLWVLDGGSCQGGIESTIIKIQEGKGVILRPGLITQKQLEEVLKIPFETAHKGSKVEAPGMKYRHYAPKAKVILIYDEDDFIKRSLTDNEAMFLSKRKINAKRSKELSEATLYNNLREADLMGIHTIYIYVTPDLQEGLLNRLKKAAG